MKREQEQQKKTDQLGQQEEQKKQEMKPAMEEGPSRYKEILGGVRIGGYGSLRFESSSLKEVNESFTFRRFVLTVDAPIAERLRSAVEVEFERFTQLELERSTRPAAGGLTVKQAVGAPARPISPWSRPGSSTS